eukprot:61358_1
MCPQPNKTNCKSRNNIRSCKVQKDKKQLDLSVRIHDLCAEDKAKIGNLVKQLATTKRLKECEIERLKDGNKKYEIALTKLKNQNEKIVHHTVSIRSRFGKSLDLLRSYQKRLKELHQQKSDYELLLKQRESKEITKLQKDILSLRTELNRSTSLRDSMNKDILKKKDQSFQSETGSKKCTRHSKSISSIGEETGGTTPQARKLPFEQKGNCREILDTDREIDKLTCSPDVEPYPRSPPLPYRENYLCSVESNVPNRCLSDKMKPTLPNNIVQKVQHSWSSIPALLRPKLQLPEDTKDSFKQSSAFLSYDSDDEAPRSKDQTATLFHCQARAKVSNQRESLTVACEVSCTDSDDELSIAESINDILTSRSKGYISNAAEACASRLQNSKTNLLNAYNQSATNSHNKCTFQGEALSRMLDQLSDEYSESDEVGI